MALRVMEPNGNKSVATVLPGLASPGRSGPWKLSTLLRQSARGGGHDGRVVQVSDDIVGGGEEIDSQAVVPRVHAGRRSVVE